MAASGARTSISKRTDDAKAAIVVPPPAEKHAELHGDSAGNGSGNGHRQRVVIADVAEF
jgi:hypothetical protein